MWCILTQESFLVDQGISISKYNVFFYAINTSTNVEGMRGERRKVLNLTQPQPHQKSRGSNFHLVHRKPYISNVNFCRHQNSTHPLNYDSQTGKVVIFYVATSSTSELNTKLGNVVVISLQTTNHMNCPSRQLRDCKQMTLKDYLRYGSVMIFNNEGFRLTKLCHSDLSIFPSWSMSASRKVCQGLH